MRAVSTTLFFLLISFVSCKNEKGPETVSDLESASSTIDSNLAGVDQNLVGDSLVFVRKIEKESDLSMLSNESEKQSEDSDLQFEEGSGALNKEATKLNANAVKEEKTISPIKSSKSKSKTKPKKKVKSKAIIEFADTQYDFGRIVQGEVIEHEFVFTNKGKAPLVIKNAEATCGCTQPIYPFIPIEAGQTGKIFVQFKSKGRLGGQSPAITITSNATEPIIKLHLRGEVVTKEYAGNTEEGMKI